MVAEKFHAACLLGIANTRMKDYFDLWILLAEQALETVELRRTVEATFDRRKLAMPRTHSSGLNDAFVQGCCEAKAMGGLPEKESTRYPGSRRGRCAVARRVPETRSLLKYQPPQDIEQMTFTAAQLHQLLDDNMQEWLYLEFKRGAALAPSNGSRQELVKDCTGFANAGGGTILYGVAEEEVEGVPAAASLSPVTAPGVGGDWFTDFIRSNTSPPQSRFC